MKDAEVGDFEFVKEPATMGKNQGNHFTILLHGIEENNEDAVPILQSRLDTILHTVKETGYLNYYGLQRFGNQGNNIPIGCHMLRSEWKEAVMLLLRSGTNKIVEKAISLFESSGDGAEAAKILPKFMSTEITLFKALGKSGGKGYSVSIPRG